MNAGHGGSGSEVDIGSPVLSGVGDAVGLLQRRVTEEVVSRTAEFTNVDLVDIPATADVQTPNVWILTDIVRRSTADFTWPSGHILLVVPCDDVPVDSVGDADRWNVDPRLAEVTVYFLANGYLGMDFETAEASWPVRVPDGLLAVGVSARRCCRGPWQTDPVDTAFALQFLWAVGSGAQRCGHECGTDQPGRQARMDV